MVYPVHFCYFFMSTVVLQTEVPRPKNHSAQNKSYTELTLTYIKKADPNIIELIKRS